MTRDLLGQTPREAAISWIKQMSRNEVQRTLLLHAPENWHDEDLDQIEGAVMDWVSKTVEAIPNRVLAQNETVAVQVNRAIVATSELIAERTSEDNTWESDRR